MPGYKPTKQASHKKGKKKREKLSRLNYSEEALAEAMKDVAKGIPYRAASIKHKVPFSTIRCKHLGIYPIGKKSGPSTILTEDEEKELVDWMILMSKKGFPLTKQMLLDSVAHIMKKFPEITLLTMAGQGGISSRAFSSDIQSYR